MSYPLPKSTVLAILMLATTLSLHSQTTLNEASFLRLVKFETGKTAVHLEHGDLDGDSKEDIVVANYGSNSISIFRNISNSFIGLASKIDLTTSAHPTSIAIADLNHDGKSEIIASIEDGSVAVFKNISTSGSIAFESEIATPTGSYAVALAVADIDNDTYPDIAVLNNQSFTISVYSNADKTGGINLQQTASVSTNSASQDVIFANINDDAKPEMIVTNYFMSSVSVYVNASATGSIAFGERIDFVTDASPHTVRAGDVDGDNKPDLVVGHSNSFILSVLLNKSIGTAVTLAPPQNFLTGQTPYGIAITDLDNDGRPDIATGNFSQNNMSVLINTTKATEDTVSFATAYAYDNNNGAPYDLIAFDVEGDGYKELITANFNLPASISIFYNVLGDAARTVPSISSFIPMFGEIGTIVIISGKGYSSNISDNQVFFGSIRAEVLKATDTELTVRVPEGAAYGVISVVCNNFVGSSAYPFNVTFPGGDGGVVYNIDFFAKQADLPGNNPRTVKFADFDGDNKPDIIFTQQAGDKVTIYRNTSTPGLIAYGEITDLLSGPGPFGLTINDFNGDGKADIAVANFNSGLESTASIFKNTSTRGKISFVKVLTIAAGSGASGIVSSDFNFDGKTDLGIAAGNAGYYYYMQNTGANGSIAFESMESIRNWNHAITMVDGDIDGDSIADVVTTNFSGASITVNINDGEKAVPIFSSSTDIPVGQHPLDAAIGDLDGDGKQDILVVNSGSRTVSVLRNISTLRAPAFEIASVETDRGGVAVSLGDLDGDGRLEMIVASGEPDKIGIYKNLSAAGKIVFGQPAYFKTGVSPTDVACGDLDGDGKPDLAIANSYSVVTIVRNTFGEPIVTPSGTSPVYGAITQQSIYDSMVNTHQGQPYVQRHYEVTPANNPNTSTGTIKLFFRQGDFDAFNAHPDHGLNLPMGPSDSAGISNLRVYQYHGTSSEGSPGTYSGSTVVIDPDDARIAWNDETEWWDISFEVQGFSGFFVSVKGGGMDVPSTAADSKLQVYPNPAYGRVIVKHPVSDAAFIRIIDMRGNMVRVVPLKNDASQSEISIYGLPSGIYQLVWRNVNSMHVKTLMVK